jgi:hypothetical protein
MVEATDTPLFPPHSTGGVPFELWNDDEFAKFLQDLLTRTLHERPEALNFARGRAQAWRKAHALVAELERTGGTP